MYNFAQTEAQVLQFWQETSAFKESNFRRSNNSSFIFYDGPPFATGLPHYGHLLVGAIKDCVARYQNMLGKPVPRRWGWDCHGVPVESLVQKYLNLTQLEAIQQNRVAEFNQTCQNSVLTCADQWKETVARLGRWVDFDQAYKTMDSNYMESVWWVFKQLFDQNRIYRAQKIMPYSCKLQTTLSNHEVADSYRKVQDPYVIVAFPVINQSYSVLVYTTTPWTLPANAGICLNPTADYSVVKAEATGKSYLLATQLVEKVLKSNYQIMETNSGSYYAGQSYSFLWGAVDHKIVTDPYVTITDGTGAVHLAPMFGEDDYRVGQQNQLEMIDHLDAEGTILLNTKGNFVRLFCKDGDLLIVAELQEQNYLFESGTVTHDYPYCSRTGTPLIYRAIPSWYLRLEDVKDRLLAHNATISWIPSAIGTQRFANWLSEAKDWNISRNRLWGTCLPLWQAEDGELICVGSKQELADLTGLQIEEMHKHSLDSVIFERNGKSFRRVPEVLDCWFESGCMPYAQHHYPFENKELVEQNLPADFIVEGLDQTRGWFYTLLVLSTLLFDRAPFKNVMVNGLVLAEDGVKMSKSKANYPEVKTILDRYGADALRAYLLGSAAVAAEPLCFQTKNLEAMQRNLFNPIWNVLEFYQLQVKVHDFQPDSTLHSNKMLDAWIMSRLNVLVARCNDKLSTYQLAVVLHSIVEFLDHLCNWYVRLCKKTLVESTNTKDKTNILQILHQILLTVTKLLAPFVPFFSEQVFHDLGYAGSVHWQNYPQAVEDLDAVWLDENMKTVRCLTSLGRKLRERVGRKTRQPLAQLWIYGLEDLPAGSVRLLKQELNVKEVTVVDRVSSTFSSWKAAPNFRVLAKICGKETQKVAQEIKLLSQNELNQWHQSQQPLNIAGFEVAFKAADWTEQVDSPYLTEKEGELRVMLDPNLTPQLVEEGDLREVLAELQILRKNHKLNLTDCVDLLYCGTEEAVSFLQNHQETIQQHVKISRWSQDSSWTANCVTVGHQVELSMGKCYFKLVENN